MDRVIGNNDIDHTGKLVHASYNSQAKIFAHTSRMMISLPPMVVVDHVWRLQRSRCISIAVMMSVNVCETGGDAMPDVGNMR